MTVTKAILTNMLNIQHYSTTYKLGRCDIRLDAELQLPSSQHIMKYASNADTQF